MYSVPARFVVAWTVAAAEDSEMAKDQLEQAMGGHGVPDVAHADRGTSGTPKTGRPAADRPRPDPLAFAPTRVQRQPIQHAASKTLKDTLVLPENFGSLPDARAFADAFFGYYNHGTISGVFRLCREVASSALTGLSCIASVGVSCTRHEAVSSRDS